MILYLVSIQTWASTRKDTLQGVPSKYANIPQAFDEAPVEILY
jgi:hypothetical protein